MNVRHNYKKSVESVFNLIKKTLSYTIVKDYEFKYSEHFIDRLYERRITMNSFSEMINILCSENRIVFSKENKLIIEYDNIEYVCQVWHNIFGSFRRILFVTVYTKNEFQNKKSDNVSTFIKLRSINESN